MFIFNKNYEELMSHKKYERMKEYFEDSPDANNSEMERYKVFTLEFVIKKVIDYS